MLVIRRETVHWWDFRVFPDLYVTFKEGFFFFLFTHFISCSGLFSWSLIPDFGMSSVRPLSPSPLPGAQAHLSQPGPGCPEVIPDVEIFLTSQPTPTSASLLHPPPPVSPPGPGLQLHQGWQRPLRHRLYLNEHMTYKAAPPLPPLLLHPSPSPTHPPHLSSTSGAHYRGDSKSEGGVRSLHAECVCARERERERYLTRLLWNIHLFSSFVPFSFCFFLLDFCISPSFLCFLPLTLCLE